MSGLRSNGFGLVVMMMVVPQKMNAEIQSVSQEQNRRSITEPMLETLHFLGESLCGDGTIRNNPRRIIIGNPVPSPKKNGRELQISGSELLTASSIIVKK